MGSMLQSCCFLLLAIALLWDGTGWSLLGLLVAITPMVLFSSSVMNSSGIEIASCLAFAAAGVRIARAAAHVPAWVWVTFAASGVVAILAGPLGVVFGLADLAVFIALLGARGFRTIRERQPV